MGGGDRSIIHMVWGYAITAERRWWWWAGGREDRGASELYPAPPPRSNFQHGLRISL